MSTKIRHSKSVNLIPGSPVWTGVDRGTVAWSGFVDRGAYHRMKKITPEGVIFLEEVIVFGIFAAGDLF